MKRLGYVALESVRFCYAGNHLTEHAKQIDSIFVVDVPNMSHEEISEAGGMK